MPPVAGARAGQAEGVPGLLGGAALLGVLRPRQPTGRGEAPAGVGEEAGRRRGRGLKKPVGARRFVCHEISQPPNVTTPPNRRPPPQRTKKTTKDPGKRQLINHTLMIQMA